MSDFTCAQCNATVPVTNWDLVPSKAPQTYFCGQCKSGNMLSRKALLLSLAPSLSLLLAVALVARFLALGLWVLFALLAAYVVGLPIGAWAARRYGKLVSPYGPWL